MVKPQPRTEWATLTQTDCTSWIAAPIADTIYANSFAGAGIVYAMFLYSHNKTAAILTGLGGFGIGFVLNRSAKEGYADAKECQELKEYLRKK